jgi:hypothetical protein
MKKMGALFGRWKDALTTSADPVQVGHFSPAKKPKVLYAIFLSSLNVE